MDSEATCGKRATRNYSYWPLNVRNSEQEHQVEIAKVNKVARKLLCPVLQLPFKHPTKDAQLSFQILFDLLTYTKFIQD